MFASFKNSISKRYKIIVATFFLLYLVVGVLIFTDYGISWDELYRREAGYRVLNFIISGDLYSQTTIYKLPQYQVALLRETGNIFVVFLALLERLFSFIIDIKNIFFLRHLATFLFFFLSVFFFYKTVKMIFEDWKVGLLGSLLLISTPRIFASSFYNPKDIPFLSMFIITTYVLLHYLKNKSIPNSILLALCCGLLISINYIGAIIPIFIVAFFIADYILYDRKDKRHKLILSGLLIYVFTLPLFVLLFWPTLLPTPFKIILESFKFMTNIPWGGTVLYFGKYIDAETLPWHYLPVWIIITTPVVYLLFFITFCEI